MLSIILSFRFAEKVSVGDEMLIQENDHDELTPTKIINVATSVMEGECMIYKFIVIQLFLSIQLQTMFHY